MADGTTATSVLSILALDFVFTMATGMTGIHNLIIDTGAGIGAELGIEPLFSAEAAGGHVHTAAEAAQASSGAASESIVAANDNGVLSQSFEGAANDNAVLDDCAGGHYDFVGGELVCHR